MITSPGSPAIIPGFLPAEHGMLAWTYDPVLAPSSSTPAAAGTLNLVRVRAPAALQASAVRLIVASAGATLTAGQNLAGLYTAGGSLIASTGDLSSGAQSFLTAGASSFTLIGAPYSLPAADYYVGFFWNGTTAPQFARSSVQGVGIINIGLAAPNFRFATTSDTTLTTALPASYGPQAGAGVAWWAGIS